jgi:hypothetical protein
MPVRLDQGQLFEDQDFPPNNKAIYNNKKPGLHPILWMRPHVSRISNWWRDSQWKGVILQNSLPCLNFRKNVKFLKSHLPSQTFI